MQACGYKPLAVGLPTGQFLLGAVDMQHIFPKLFANIIIQRDAEKLWMLTRGFLEVHIPVSGTAPPVGGLRSV